MYYNNIIVISNVHKRSVWWKVDLIVGCQVNCSITLNLYGLSSLYIIIKNR